MLHLGSSVFCYNILAFHEADSFSVLIVFCCNDYLMLEMAVTFDTMAESIIKFRFFDLYAISLIFASSVVVVFFFDRLILFHWWYYTINN